MSADEAVYKITGSFANTTERYALERAVLDAVMPWVESEFALGRFQGTDYDEYCRFLDAAHKADETLWEAATAYYAHLRGDP